MLGAIAGDVIGSVYEWHGIKSKEFPLFDPHVRFTDDTVLTVATAECIVEGLDFGEAYQRYFMKYPDAGYGGNFKRWARGGGGEPYHSWGNGSAMRISPIGFVYGTLEESLAAAKLSAEVTHDHPEGIKGAQAVVTAIYLSRSGQSKEVIRCEVEDRFGYDLRERLDDIRPTYEFDVSCQGSVPQAIIAFLESNDFEDAIRNAISIGGDSDTIACMAGGIAEAFYGGVPAAIAKEVRRHLDNHQNGVIDRFYEWVVRE